jgi:mono/diheme cytochrome c family protein
MRAVAITVGVFIVLLLSGAVLVYSGAYDVAATRPHAPLTQRFLHAAMRHAVQRRAQDIVAPPLDDLVQIHNGVRDYREMCQPCHGAPGVDPDEVGQGLTPAPPDLVRTARTWSAPELFWILKYGVRMTGMPAWGPTHDDAELWAIVAFVRRLPTLSAEDYQTLVRAAEREPHRHGARGAH